MVFTHHRLSISMDQQFNAFFHEFSGESPLGNYHKVIALGQSPLTWEEVKEKAPGICKGWFELSHLEKEARLEFTEQFWESKLCLFPKFCHFLENFFKDIDDIGVCLTQKTFDQPFEPQLIYTLKGNVGYFRGHPPAKDEDIELLNAQFPGTTFPQDYIAFMQVHNGFHKSTDITGITPLERMRESYESFQGYFEKNDILFTKSQVMIDPSRLIPFYTSFGMPFFQCFYMDWYPEQEMGNVYCSINTKTVSDTTETADSWANAQGESLSFPYFYEWLKFYLEKIE